MLNPWKLLMHPRVYLTVEPVLLVFMFAQFLSYPAYQNLVRTIVCQNTPNCSTNASRSENNSTCGGVPTELESQVQSEASHWILYSNLAMGLPAICFSILYGSVSDQIGRKPFIFLPALGAVLNSAVILEVAYLKDSLPIYLCLVGSLVSGLYGGYSILNSAAYSYAADVTAHSGRTRQIGLLESMTYLGATLSLLVGGIWMEKDNSLVSIFWCIIGCYIAVMAYTLLALPESVYFSRHRSEDAQMKSTYNRKFSQTHKFSRACGRFMKAIRQNMYGFFKLLLTNWRVGLLFFVFFVVEINFLGITDIVFLYALGRPLCWSFQTIGYFLSLKVFLNGVASLLVLPLLLATGLHDAIIAMVGLVAGCMALLLMGVATTTWIMFMVPVVGALRGCVVPCVRSMLSKQVPADKQGILFSSMGIVESVCTLLASVIYNSIYPATQNIHKGFSFFMMAVALVLPFTLLLVFYLLRNSSCELCCCCYYSNSSKSHKHEKHVSIESKPLLQ